MNGIGTIKCMSKQIKVHFMGICGSGASSIAVLAKQKGFEVTGCDNEIKSYYNKGLLDNNIIIEKGHNSNHLHEVDICAISPAIMDISPNHPEVLEAKRRGILMTWQEFMARYLQVDMKVLSIAGTHGKSTTTIMLGVILEHAGLDPNVISGTTYKDWGKGARIGTSDYFVCEADEFNRNFLNYESGIAVINNLEMDHPESFRDFTDMINAFKEFVMKLKDTKVLIINEDSSGNQRLLYEMKDWLIEHQVKVVGYYINNRFEFPYHKEYRVSIRHEASDSISFDINYNGISDSMLLNIPGEYNVNNAMSAICVAKELGIQSSIIADGLKMFKGVGRRFELVGIASDIRIYDDYAHHPTAVEVVLNMCKSNFKSKTIWAIFEPHQISRIESLFDGFTQALSIADNVIITKTHIGRDLNKGFQPIPANRWIQGIGEKAVYLEEVSDILDFVNNKVTKGDIIVVFGAANSYHISRAILEEISSNTSLVLK